jgi:hypothetical protein
VSEGHIWLGIGLGLDVLGTLFISLDALRGQTQATQIYKVLAFITGFELADVRLRPGDEEAGKLAVQALEKVPADASDYAKAVAANLRELNNLAEIVTEATRIADGNNKEILKEMLDKVSGEFVSRKYLIAAAIATVFLGGVCEFVGGVIFS